MSDMARVVREASLSDKIATTALVLALIAIGISIWTLVEQRKQWRASNLPRVEIVDAGFVYWGRYSLEVARSKSWGYTAMLGSQMVDRIVSNDYVLINRLRVFDTKEQRYLDQYRADTVDEMLRQLSADGFEPGRALIQQYSQIEFGFQNLGVATATELVTDVSGFIPDNGTWQSMGKSTPIDLPPGKTIQRIAELHVPLDREIPDEVNVRVGLSYRDPEGTLHEKVEPMYYVSSTSSWKFGRGSATN
ncbi:MAG: hypothetical protein LC687_08215 [Actinobacteria bacterium]|nr:hypothetical protein [Actinomycetota bacterium]